MPDGSFPGQYGSNQYFSVPTQNRFGPLGEWVGYSMGINETIDESSEMEVQWIPVQNQKRKRFNTGGACAGAGMDTNFHSLSMDDKLSHMYEKLQNLELSNQTISQTTAQISQKLNTVQGKVGHVENKLNGHEIFLKVLAYKSMDIEARSRRCNLIFHGLAEFKNECLSDVLKDFLWNEMGIDADSLFIDRFHRLGSLIKAKQKRPNENPRRPVIIAFQDYKSVERVMNAAYMLANSGFSVTRDYPKEIVVARQRLLPRYKAERRNFNNKVSIEFPAKLVVNSKIVADEFPEWHSLLAYDRYQLANGNTSMAMPQQTVTPPLRQGVILNPVMVSTNSNVHGVQQVVSTPPQPPQRPYAQVAQSTVRPQMLNAQPVVTSTVQTNVPRYGPVVSSGPRVSQGQGVTTFTTMSTTTTTVFTTTGSRPFMSAGRNVNSDTNHPRDQQYHNL